MIFHVASERTSVPGWGQEGWMKQRNLGTSCVTKTNKSFCFQPLFCVIPLQCLSNNWGLSTSICFSVFDVCCSDFWPALHIQIYCSWWKVFFGCTCVLSWELFPFLNLSLGDSDPAVPFSDGKTESRMFWSFETDFHIVHSWDAFLGCGNRQNHSSQYEKIAGTI